MFNWFLLSVCIDSLYLVALTAASASRVGILCPGLVQNNLTPYTGT